VEALVVRLQLAALYCGLSVWIFGYILVMPLSRRDLLTATAAALPLWQSIALLAGQNQGRRPNFLFLVGEDTGPDLGCYGDKLARTPNLDRLASQGCRFTKAFTHAPVCAPSRCGLITGQYPTTLGSHHMRSKLVTPPPIFTDYLRKAGYYVAWPGKTDFNFDVPAGAFDSTAQWLKEPPKAKQPFFAYLNMPQTHESQIRIDSDKEAKTTHARLTAALKAADRQDPARMVLPPFYPDDPTIRRQIANYYELVTATDYRASEVLRVLDENGLAENTVVFYFGDHGRGIPRYKRWVYDTGIHVALMVRWPGMIKPGTVRNDLVSFIDFAPTVLTLAGVEVPAQMQGQNFLTADGQAPPKERKYVFAARDRMDETFDRIRCVRDGRFKYIRNFYPDLPYAQQINYNELNPTMQAWRAANKAGKLNETQSLFFTNSKPPEELYDCDSDPYEVKNLISSGNPDHQAKLRELRSALDDWITQTKDLGAVAERELINRGVVKNVLKEYEERAKQHNHDLTPSIGPTPREK
jgi:N-sulfoglucosamine sulfohydrolase